jgi:hypothetical protein
LKTHLITIVVAALFGVPFYAAMMFILEKIMTIVALG